MVTPEKILPSHRLKNCTIVLVYFRVRKEKREYGQGKGEAHKIQEMGEGLLVKEAAGTKIGCRLGKSAPPLHLLAAAASTNPSHLRFHSDKLTNSPADSCSHETSLLTSHLKLKVSHHI